MQKFFSKTHTSSTQQFSQNIFRKQSQNQSKLNHQINDSYSLKQSIHKNTSSDKKIQLKPKHRVKLSIHCYNQSNNITLPQNNKIADKCMGNASPHSYTVLNSTNTDQKLTSLTKALKNKFSAEKQQVTFVPISPNRVCRYNHYSTSDCNQVKWRVSVQKYMQARQKMSNIFREAKNSNGQFGELELDKKNEILRKQKFKQIKAKNKTLHQIKNQQKIHKHQFVSHLYQDIKKYQNNSILKQITYNTNGTLRRCDALLVNFVSTYFRRKFHPRNKKLFSTRKSKTDWDQPSTKLFGIEGKNVKQKIIHGYFYNTTTKSKNISNKMQNKNDQINKNNNQVRTCRFQNQL